MLEQRSGVFLYFGDLLFINVSWKAFSSLCLFVIYVKKKKLEISQI